MRFSRLPQGHLRFDEAQSLVSPHVLPTSAELPETSLPWSHTELGAAIDRTRDWLLSRQHGEGYWVGELEGDSILESEYILLLAWLGRERSSIARKAAESLRQQQRSEGGWSLYPGGPLEVSASVKAYFALKLCGTDPESEEMTRARKAILAAGGAERVNSFTRYYLALLGVISYRQCPAVPPELVLLPRWMPFSIHEMSAWSRTIVVPLSLLWAYQPVRRIPEAHGLRELFVTSPEQMPLSMGTSEQLDGMRRRTVIDWEAFFRWGDCAWKFLERCRIKPFRTWAVQQAADWLLKRLAHSDGLGAIFPPIVWSIVALRCLGYAEDSPEVVGQLRELEKLTIEQDDAAWLEPCRSPVWDTALTTLALQEAGVPCRHPAVRKATAWLVSREVRRRGDWSEAHPEIEPSGWYFEFRNEFYPDVDDTSMVVMALARGLSDGLDRPWLASLSPTLEGGLHRDAELSAILAGRTHSVGRALSEVAEMAPALAAIRRGVRWILALQSRNGGWGAFDADNDRELLTRVPFADHNAMIDPPTADITARVLEMFGRLGLDPTDPPLARALEFVWREQEADGCWYGRWGVNYIYGTWQVLVGLRQIGVPGDDPRLQRAADWLVAHQQSDGGWGETPESYDRPVLRGQGRSTASQTAWALMGLMAAGRTDSDSATRAIHYLLATQEPDGTWEEPEFTGTGFPRVFYLRYHMYRVYFPLMALARYARETRRSLPGSSAGAGS
jgi:squalene-hopene/tetraprenyl-beta-curcumene cyclase